MNAHQVPLRRWLPMSSLVPVFIVAFLLSRTGTVVLQADLSPQARATWQLLEWQYQRLRADLNGLDTRVRVLTGSESRAMAAATLPADWLRRTAAGLTQAVAFECLVQELLGQQGPPSSAYRGPDSLNRTFRALWDAVVNTRQVRGAPES